MRTFVTLESDHRSSGSVFELSTVALPSEKG